MSNRRKLNVDKLPSLNGVPVAPSDDRPGESVIAGRGLPGPGEINAYVCRICYKLTVVQHVDSGVTPMYLACRASECNGQARSMGYPPNPPEKVKKAVRFEWYRPDAMEFSQLDPEMKQHVSAGGLLLREKKKQ